MRTKPPVLETGRGGPPLSEGDTESRSGYRWGKHVTEREGNLGQRIPQFPRGRKGVPTTLADCGPGGGLAMRA